MSGDESELFILQVLAEVTYALRPSGVTGLFFNDSEPVSTDMVVTLQGESLLVGFEQGVKAGTVKGRIELQFVQEVTREGKRIYAGEQPGMRACKTLCGQKLHKVLQLHGFGMILHLVCCTMSCLCKLGVCKALESSELMQDRSQCMSL